MAEKGKGIFAEAQRLGRAAERLSTDLGIRPSVNKKELGENLSTKSWKKAGGTIKRILSLIISEPFLQKLKKVGMKMAGKLIGQVASKCVPFLGGALVVGGIIGAIAEAQNDPIFVERLVAEIPKGRMVGVIQFSPSGQTVAFPVSDGNRWAVQINGNRGPWFDEVTKLFFGPDGRSVFYQARAGHRRLWLRNHVRLAATFQGEDLAFDEVGQLWFSAGGAFTYPARAEGVTYLVINLTAHRLGEDVEIKYVDFIGETDHVFCLGFVGERKAVWIDGKEDPVFSKDVGDYEYLRYFALESGKAGYFFRARYGRYYFLVAGRVRASYDEARPLRLDSNRLLLAALRDRQVLLCTLNLKTEELEEKKLVDLPPNWIRWEADARGNVAWVESVEGGERLRIKGPDFDVADPPFDDVDFDSLRWRSKARTYRYLARRAGRSVVVVNGKAGKDYKDIDKVFWSAAGVIAYSAQLDDGRWVQVVGETPGPAFDQIDPPDFAPDGKTVTYTGRRDGKVHRVVGSWVSERGYVEARKPVFSTDGKSWIFRASVTGGPGWVAVANGREGPVFGMVGVPAMAPDGRAYAYRARTLRGKDVLVFNDQMIEWFDAVLTDPVFSDDSTRLAFGARIGRDIWWKVLEVEK